MVQGGNRVGLTLEPGVTLRVGGILRQDFDCDRSVQA
jgi:hypothetical protein